MARYRSISTLALAFAGLALLPQLAAGSMASRRTLRDRLSFRYVAQPNSSSYTPDTLNNAAILAGTESGAFWTSAAMTPMKELVRALLRDRAHGGDGSLQDYAASVVGIINKPVIVYLLDDTAATLTGVARQRWGATLDTSNRCWPSAINMSLSDDFRQQAYPRVGLAVPPRRDGTWAGQMALGAHNYTHHHQYTGTNGRRSRLGTFLHELVHTQDKSDSRGHAFWVNGRNMRYGNDDVHWAVEAVPNMAMTYKEGIANTFSMLYSGNASETYFQWFATNGALWVEKNPNPTTAGPGAVPAYIEATAPSPDAWLFNQINAIRPRIPQLAAPSSAPTGVSAATYAFYRIRSLPPRFIVHNEYILALTFSEYVRHITFNRYMTALRRSNRTLFGVSASGVAVLFEELCKAGLPAGQTAESMQVSTADPKPYLLPLAYADYFTGYNAQNRSDYAAIFEGRLPDAWVRLYWEGVKDEVRRTAPMSTPPVWGDVTNIAIALGITQSQPD